MIAWLIGPLAAVDWWLWIALAACALLVAGLWMLPALPTSTRALGTAGIVVAVAIGLLLHGWQAERARADEAEASFAAERDLRASAELQLQAERAAAMERAADDRAIDDLSKDMTDAIDKAATREPGKAPGPATVALGCIRLRSAGATAGAEYKRLCP
jgi:type VI protein secretion system component VasK